MLPQVVVAAEVVHLDAGIGEFADFAQQARVALGHHVAVLVPEVEEVAHEIDGLRPVLDAVEEIGQLALFGASVLYGQAAQVGV